MNRAIPKDLSFIFTVRNLRSNHAIQEAKPDGGIDWMPPTKRNAFISEQYCIFLWSGGEIHELKPASSLGAPFGSATVFTTRRLDSGHLLAVELDAHEKDVDSTDQGWRELTFHHEQVDSSGRTYSSVACLGSEEKIAAPSKYLRKQLLPKMYDCQQADASVTNAGLIGSLPILLAMAAFTAAPSQLTTIFTQCVGPGIWRNHEQFGYDCR